MKTIYKILFLFFLCLISCSRLAYVDYQVGTEVIKYPHIRVKILDADKMNIRCQGTYRLNCVVDDSTNRGYFSVAALDIKASTHGLYIAEKNGFILDSNLSKIFVSPRKRQNNLLINADPFRGILLLNFINGKLEVINILNIEDYLKGVLPPEIGRLDKKAYEALKTQAVAARTYAFSRIRSNADNEYDVVNNIMDQVYRGIKGEYKLANEAIEDTRGEIMTYNGKLISAYYHSTCGGKTEFVENVWDKHENGYLKSIDDEGYCEWSKFSEWEMTWNSGELEEYLCNYLKEKREFIGETFKIVDIKILEKFESGRNSHLKVITDKGEFLLFKDQIRWAFRRPGRPDQILPSSNFNIRIWRNLEGEIEEITASGSGYGHGVGMCQTGAIGRARAGHKYDQILKTYYSGIEIEKAY